MAALTRFLLLLGPLLEIASLILVGSEIGVGWTLLAVVVDVVLGVAVIRIFGRASLAEVRDAVARQEPPVGGLLRGAAALAAGVLFIMPGFASDVLAIMLLLPGLQQRLGSALWRGLGPTVTAGGVPPYGPKGGVPPYGPMGGVPPRGPAGGGRVIEGVFEEVRPGEEVGPNKEKP